MTAKAEIRRRISAHGAITFAEFMEVALYHPEGGYYTSGERIGAAGDYYTSPSVHPAFGALLAVQFFQIWQLLERPPEFTVVEGGAENGLLCRDVMAAAESFDPEFARSLRYVCLDRRVTPGLERGLASAYRIASNSLPLQGVVGCVLSNELLDAFPVHLATVQDGQLRELWVTADGGELTLVAKEPSTPLLAERLETLAVALEEGQVAEISLGLEGWVEEVAQALERGFVLTIDYGRLAESLYSPTERFRGTLTTYRDHLQTDRPLERIGQQDMSAQVDFTSLGRAGGEAGLDFLGYTTQADFLGNLGLDRLLQRTWADGQHRKARQSAIGMRELSKPDGLGNFKVMAFGKNAGQPELWGFNRSKEAAELAERMPLPVPTTEHIDLAAGRFPSAETEFEVAWDALWPDDAPSP